MIKPTGTITGTLQVEDADGYTITLADDMDYRLPRGAIVGVVEHNSEDLITLEVYTDYLMKEGL